MNDEQKKNIWSKRDTFYLRYPDWNEEWWVYKVRRAWLIMHITDDGVSHWDDAFRTSQEAMAFVDAKIKKWEAIEEAELDAKEKDT